MNPRLGGASDVWIDIFRGVKQGCPLSPLIFAIVVDPLLQYITKFTKCTPCAHADDLALAVTKKQYLKAALHLTDCFSKASGAQQNYSKTAIVTAKPDEELDSWIKNDSGWPLLQIVNKYVYLGVLMGRNVILEDISKAIDKLVKRSVKYRGVVRLLSHAKRVLIYNVFVISILSCLTNFFLLKVSARS